MVIHAHTPRSIHLHSPDETSKHPKPAITLPKELLILIIEQLVQPFSRAILPASHEVTRTLLALTQMSRHTNATATRLLWRHCVFLDAFWRAESLARVLRQKMESGRATEPALELTRMFLAPYRTESRVLPHVEGCGVDARGAAVAERQAVDGDSSDSDSIRSDVLSPLSDRCIAECVRNILLLLAPTLKNLVINIPLRSLYPEDDIHRIRAILREGFEALRKLREFVSVQDELYLDTKGPPSDEPLVWATCWPDLENLALYNPDLEAHRDPWLAMTSLRKLRTVAFVRPDPPFAHFGEMNLTQKWADSVAAVDESSQSNSSISYIPAKDGRVLRFAVVNCPDELEDFDDGVLLVRPNQEGTRDLEAVRMEVSVPTPPFTAGDVDPIKTCQSWVEMKALNGDLWDAIHSVS